MIGEIEAQTQITAVVLFHDTPVIRVVGANPVVHATPPSGDAQRMGVRPRVAQRDGFPVSVHTGIDSF